jgi:hypothetical protein
MIIAVLALNLPRVIVDLERFKLKEMTLCSPLGFPSGEKTVMVGMTEVDSDGTIYVSSQEVANETRTYHYAGKETNIMVCDQTGEQIATPSSNHEYH